MPIKYFHPGDEDQLAAQAPIPFDGNDDASWWAGIQKCAATVAIASALAFATASVAAANSLVAQHQDDPAGHLFGQPDEDFWVNPAAPVKAALGPLYLPDPEEIPAGKLFGQPDEDLWQNAVRPVPASFYQQLPYLFDIGEIVPASAFLPDEDLWGNSMAPVATVYQWPQQSAFDTQEPAGSLFGPEEDFWVNPVAPVKAALGPLYLPDPEEIPAGKLFGQPDEDLWQNAVRPVPASFYQQLPCLFDIGEIVPSVAFLPEEDLWQNPIAPAWPANIWPQQSAFDVQDPAGSLFGPEEDLWVNAVAPVKAAFGSLYLPDPEEIPAGKLFGQPDEDFWMNAVRPMAAGFYQQLPYLFDAGDIGPPSPITDPLCAQSGSVRMSLEAQVALVRLALGAQSGSVRQALLAQGARAVMC